ncbi:MAG: roadblock/LC7 domain-containing protein [Promethearchaeota archaeon]
MTTEVDIPQELQMRLMRILENLESTTDLEGVAIISYTGLRIACADRAETDADQFSASPAALISLGQKIGQEHEQGQLKEIVIQGTDGYSILTIGEGNFYLVAHCKKSYKLGYYFKKIRGAFREIESLLKGIEIGEAVY